MNAGTLRISTELDTKNFDAQIKQVESEIADLETTLSSRKELNLSSREVGEVEAKLEKAKNKLVQLNKKANETQNSFEEVKQSSSGIGSALNSAVGKMAKLGLAVFGIRSAYSAVRSAMSTISQYDDKMANDLEYIQFALAMTLKPIIEWIIQAVYQLLGLLNSISLKIFNYNLFANSSADAFKKAKNNASGLNKELKKLQTSKFDEMNILGKDTASSGGVGGGNTPSMDLSKINIDFNSFSEIFNKLAKMVDNFTNTIKQNVMKVLLDLGFSKQFIAFWGTMFDGLRQQLSGLVKFVGGILDVMFGLFTGNTEQVKKGIDNLLQGIKDIFMGYLTFATGWIGMVATILIDGFKAIFKGIGDAIGKLWNNIWGGLKNTTTNTFNSMKSTISSVVNSIKTTMTNAFNTIYNALSSTLGKASKSIDNLFNGIKNTFKAVINVIIDGLNKLIKGMNKISVKVPKWVPEIGGNSWGINIPTIPKLATGGIVNMPGRGTFVGGAIAGERGAEGVIPLTDSQAMLTLGEAIGRYITINASITNSMNGKVLSRELQRINNSNNFAMNR